MKCVQFIHFWLICGNVLPLVIALIIILIMNIENSECNFRMVTSSRNENGSESFGFDLVVATTIEF